MLKTVEFVPLKSPERARVLCALAEEFFLKGERVVIVIQDDNQGVSLDQYMWVWKKGSFLPHVYDNGSVESFDEPVVILAHEDNPNGARVLIQGRICTMEFVSQFRHVIDFAELYDDALRQNARERFRLFREMGLEPRMRE
ncbi:MAG: DNA polymerase III subunit chi [Desulfuromonadales bacterium]|nr:DNA polymerase III subunit chi [Desulfuromonadales bacterium]